MPAKAGFRGLILTRWSSPTRPSENSFSLRRNRFFSGFPTEREVTTRARARKDEIEKPTVQEACERRLAPPPPHGFSSIDREIHTVLALTVTATRPKTGSACLSVVDSYHAIREIDIRRQSNLRSSPSIQS